MSRSHIIDIQMTETNIKNQPNPLVINILKCNICSKPFNSEQMISIKCDSNITHKICNSCHDNLLKTGPKCPFCMNHIHGYNLSIPTHREHESSLKICLLKCLYKCVFNKDGEFVFDSIIALSCMCGLVIAVIIIPFFVI